MGILLVSLDELLQQSDVISIHAPLTPETLHTISTSETEERMKNGACIVNMGKAEL